MIREIWSIFQFSECKHFPISQKFTIPEYNTVPHQKQRKVFSVDVKNNFNMSCVDKSHTCAFFLNCYLAAPRPTLGHFRGDSLTHLMLITVFLHFWPEDHREPCNEVGSLSPAERLVGFEPGTFRFLLQGLNSLGYSPRKCMSHTQNVKFYKLLYLIIFVTSTFTNTTFQFSKY